MNQDRLKVVARGAVQGVGFRPFVFGLATSLGLRGWVSNTAQGVFVEVEGPRAPLDQFLLRLESGKPSGAMIQSLEFSFLDAVGYDGFEIRPSDNCGEKSAFILPDIATCAECLSELLDPANRRHLYPFTNCTHCGPRFSIIESLPYDRPNTSMDRFCMCAECEEEYGDPANRRFHAQPNACPKCGPHLQLWNSEGKVLAERHGALIRAASAIASGQVLAVKGIGGFQLMVNARDEDAVRRLRERKCREEKPFALMYPNLDAARQDCQTDEMEARLLASPEAPIVLLRQGPGAASLAPSIAPRNPNLGVMLPNSPLHHLLMRETGIPVVATSGNLNNEPICIHRMEALKRLGGIADLFLVHDRPIVRQVDDSVARVVLGQEMILRRARGYAPLPIHVNHELPPLLAVGAHLKNTVAVSIGKEIFVSQHVGDLATPEAWSAHRKITDDLKKLYDLRPETVICDLHPDYLSTKHADTMDAPVARVQHHYAHVLGCMAENELDGPVLGVAWDGTGLGLDGTIWGGEFLTVAEWPNAGPAFAPFARFAHLRCFRLPGGDAAIQQPRRAALGLLWEIYKDKETDFPLREHFSELESHMLRQMLAYGINAPKTSSAGRLFDAVASIVGLRQRSHFEGQAAMELEFAIQPGVERVYPFDLIGDAEVIVDWQSMILQLLNDLRCGVEIGVLAAGFHNTLAEMIVAVAHLAGHCQVVLTGGCFQNKYLLERSARRLRDEGFRPFWHQRIPPNDGGIAVGQIVAAARAHCVTHGAREACVA